MLDCILKITFTEMLMNRLKARRSVKENFIRWVFIYFLIFSVVSHAQQENESPLEQSSEHLSSTEDKSDQTFTIKKKESPHSFVCTLTFVSDYRSRGISQSMLRPAVQGEFKYEYNKQAYLKMWGSNVDGTTHFLNNTSLELDFYMGYTQDILKSEWSYDVGLECYYYPGGQAPVKKYVTYNSIEYYVAFAYKKFNFRVYQTLTDLFGINSANPPENWDTFTFTKPNGSSRGSIYIEMNYSVELIKKCILSFHVGYQTTHNYAKLNYFDWEIGLAYSFSWFDIALAYIQTTAKRKYFNVLDSRVHPQRRNLGGPTVVLGLTKSF